MKRTKEYEFKIVCEGINPIGFVRAKTFKEACILLKFDYKKSTLLDKKPKGWTWLII